MVNSILYFCSYCAFHICRSGCVALWHRRKKELRLNAVLFITFGFQMVYASLYLAIGKSLVGSILSLSRQGIFFFPLVFVLPHLLGLTGVIWVQPMADLLTTILTVIFAVKINRALSAEVERGDQLGIRKI